MKIFVETQYFRPQTFSNYVDMFNVDISMSELENWFRDRYLFIQPQPTGVPKPHSKEAQDKIYSFITYWHKQHGMT